MQDLHRDHLSPISIRASPRLGRSAATIVCDLPSRANSFSAARYTLLDALSIVEGQPVQVHSPATKRFSIGLSWSGRIASAPGLGENVALRSFNTSHFLTPAPLHSGNTSSTSLRT